MNMFINKLTLILCILLINCNTYKSNNTNYKPSCEDLKEIVILKIRDSLKNEIGDKLYAIVFFVHKKDTLLQNIVFKYEYKNDSVEITADQKKWMESQYKNNLTINCFTEWYTFDELQEIDTLVMLLPF